MPLESATRAYDLNLNNPIDMDPVSVGAAHLRLVKAILSKGYLGTLTLEEVRASTNAVGCTFTYNLQLWYIQTNIYGTSVVEDLSNIIFMNNGNRAILLMDRYSLGTLLGSDVVKPTGLNADRYPVVRSIKGPGITFDLTAATAAVPNGTPVVGDIVYYRTNTGSSLYSQARSWTGSNWVRVDTILNGMVACHGGFSALRVSCQDVVTSNVRTGRVERIGATRMLVEDPDLFGPDNLYSWFGNHAGLIDGNGEVKYGSLSKANSIIWKALPVGGTAGGGESGGEGIGGGGSGGSGTVTPPSGGAVKDNLGMNATPVYNARTEGYSGSAVECNVTIDFLASGYFQVIADIYSGSGVIGGTYLTNVGGTVGSAYEITAIQTGGTGTVVGTTSTFSPLGTGRTLSLTAATSGGSAQTEVKTATLTITIREIATPSNTKSVTVEVEARARTFMTEIP